MSVFPSITPFSFSTAPGNALHKNKPVQNCIACRRRKAKCDRLYPCTPCKNRGEADSCEQHVKEPKERPTGYTHVSDFSILSNRVTQLELVLSRLITRVDTVDNYQDLLHEFKGPLPIFRPSEKGRDGEDRSEASVDRRRTTSLAGNGGESELGEVVVLGGQSDLQGPEGKPEPQKTVTFEMAKRSPDLSSLVPLPTQFPQQDQIADGLHMYNGGEPVYNNAVHIAPLQLLGMDQSQPAPNLQPPPSSTAAEFGQNVNLENYATADTDWMGMLQKQGPPTNEDAFDNFNPFVPGRLSGRQFSEPVSKVPSAHEHDASLALEGMALGRDFMEEPRSGGDSTLHEMVGESPSFPPTFTSFIQHKRPTVAGLARKPFPAVNQLPSLIVGKYVMSHFFNDVDFLWRCMHRPTFDKQYADLCVQLRSKAYDFTLEHLSTLALYSAILCVGIHFLDDDGYRDLNLDESQAVELAATCWKVSYEALEASDWMQVYNIRSCQTIIIAGLYMSSIRRANHHWALLGVATKIALALGLNEIPHENRIIASGSMDQFHPRWRSTITREVGRRVWQCLVELDWLFSMEHGFVYIISPEINHTSEPANIDDVDIKDDQPVISLPPDTHTEMSYSIYRHRILYPLQGVVRNVRNTGRMRYSFIVKAQEELERAVAERPMFYKHPDNLETVMDAVQLNRIKREARSLEEGTDLRTMRIHRYYFPASCENPRYLLTKQACLQRARRMLLNPSLDRTVTFQLNPHYWAIAYYTFTATVVTIIYLYHALPQELEEFKTLAERGIKRLSLLSKKGSTDLGDTTETLQSLMRVQLDRRNNRPVETEAHKRNFSEFSGEGWSNWLLPSFDQNSNMSGPVSSANSGPSLADDHNLSLMLDSLFQDVANIDSTFNLL